MTREWGLPQGLVLLDGDGHTWIALDYRSAVGEPSVVWLDVEAGDELQVASSFDELLSSLRPDAEFDADARVGAHRAVGDAGSGEAGMGLGDAVASPYGGSCSNPWHPRGMVRIEPVTKGWAAALARGDDVFSERFAVAVEPNWEGFPEVIRFLAEANRPEALYLVFDDDGALGGHAGWKGEPINGAAELRYAVAPSRQGRGIATAVVRELVARAAAAGLREVIGQTRAEESPSTSVLARCGFTKVDELIDPEDGPIWRWHLPIPDQDANSNGVEGLTPRW